MQFLTGGIAECVNVLKQYLLYCRYGSERNCQFIQFSLLTLHDFSFELRLLLKVGPHGAQHCFPECWQITAAIKKTLMCLAWKLHPS